MLGLGLGVAAVAARRRGGAGGGVPWTPSDADGTFFGWWDASDGLDVTGTTINSWTDKSGQGNTLTPTSMLTSTAKFGGAAVPRMASGGYFTSADAVSEPRTFFAVAALDSAVNAGFGGARLVRNAGNSAYVIATGSTSGLMAGELFSYVNTNTAYRGASTGTLPSGISSDEHIFATRWAAGDSDIALHLDGSGDLANIGSAGSPAWVSGVVRIAEGQASGPGHMAECIVFTTRLSDADFDRVNGYLAHKWGLQDSLPAEHPYKDAPPTA